jgi:microcystin-dependent protein
MPGSLYYATDVGAVSLSDGVKWNTITFAGEIRQTGTPTAPEGWLLCDGSPVLRTDYTPLFNALGGTSSPYGLPDGTHFNLPDFRGRTGVGAGQARDAAGTAIPLSVARTIGTKWGVDAVVLSNGQMPVHNHGGGTGVVDLSHNHNYDRPAAGGAIGADPGWVQYVGAGFVTGPSNQNMVHSHTINNDGGGAQVNIPQPSVGVNYVIKT